ncbi:peptidoglycan-binding protein [Pedobacter sp. JY14-1]|uniref:peptidoglycan-binding protein n=1 Tax=Pedobacter sp. JY14-1 TaxID=3034151 RepID=UPI0023E2E023|nr:peptidoglycan-binding protein [Pedobacter sp. JY14-1]
MAAIRFLPGLICLAIVCGSPLFAGHLLKTGVARIGHINHRNVQSNYKAYENIIRIARKEIGVREGVTQNSGQRVGEYLRYVGIGQAAPWCAAWVSWVHHRAGYALPRTAWSPALFPRSRLVEHAAPGNVFGIYMPSMKRIAHCGIVESANGDWRVTIEGNTNNSGGREGDGVYRRTRHKRSIRAYADWTGGE